MELATWKRAGIEPGGDWYRESGQGMGYSLRIADDQGAYTITDRATFIVLEEALDLEIMVEGDPELHQPLLGHRGRSGQLRRVESPGSRGLPSFF